MPLSNVDFQQRIAVLQARKGKNVSLNGIGGERTDVFDVFCFATRKFKCFVHVVGS